MRIWSTMISLDRAVERRACMRDELARAGIACAFFDAVDARLGEAALAPDTLAEGPLGPLHPHDRACTLSHVRAMEAFLETDADVALILEDDVHIAPDLAAWLAEAAAWWPEGAEMVKIERWRDDRLRVLVGPARHHRGRDLRRLLTRHSGTGGYMISRAGARKVLGARPYALPIDHVLFNQAASSVARALSIWQVTPALVVQGNDPPGITPGARPRLSGWPALRRAIKRGWREVSYPLSTWMSALSGAATFAKIDYLPTVAADLRVLPETRP